ncbi:MAG: hypothetical protein ACR2QC_09575 [Gammaproteobacteria bacterium]
MRRTKAEFFGVFAPFSVLLRRILPVFRAGVCKSAAGGGTRRAAAMTRKKRGDRRNFVENGAKRRQN